MTLDGEALERLRKRIATGGAEKYHAANAARGKLFARERVALLVDEGSFVEDGMYANALAEGLPADGVVTGLARIDGRPVCLMANDSTVKAGSWGARTVEKIIRIIERAYQTGVPMVYLVDSAGARITDQVDLFPGRRGAGRIFWNQVRASGSVPQVCALFGPSAAGGAYIPAFCDVVAMVDGNASMYLGSGRVVGVVANNSLHKGGVLFVDSADKATRFVQLCDAFNVPLLFLADVPGFMVGAAVEKQGIIRHGAKMITAISEATVPKICVVVRKAYGAGLYAMAGPGFEPDATIALPTAKIAVMGAEAAVNAVYANKIAAIADESERAAFVAAKREEYERDIDIT